MLDGGEVKGGKAAPDVGNAHARPGPGDEVLLPCDVINDRDGAVLAPPACAARATIGVTSPIGVTRASAGHVVTTTMVAARGMRAAGADRLTAAAIVTSRADAD